MLTEKPKFLAILLAIASFAVQALAAPSLLPEPRLLSEAGDEIDVINVGELEKGSLVRFSIEESFASLPVVQSWTIYIIDLETMDLVHSLEGTGRPDVDPTWNGRLDSGKLLATNLSLGIRAVALVGSETKRTQALRVSTIKSDTLWRRIDRGLHIEPVGALAVGELTMKNGVDEAKVVIFPIVSADMKFHFNRQHHFGLRFDTGSRIRDNLSGASYSFAAGHYTYTVLGEAGRVGNLLTIGGRYFGYLIATNAGSAFDDLTTRFKVAVSGPAASIEHAYVFDRDTALTTGLEYGVGIGNFSGRYMNGSIETRFPLTSQISVRSGLSYSSYAEGEEKKGNESATLKSLRVAMEVVL